MAVLRRLAAYLPPLKWPILGASLCAIGVSAGRIGLGGSARPFLDSLTRAAKHGDLSAVTRFALLTVGVFLVKGIFTYAQQWLMAGAAQQLAMRLRGDVFAHLHAQSMSFFDTRKTGFLMAAISNDVPAVQNNLTVAVLNAASAPFTVIGGVAFLFWLNWRLAAIAFLTLPVAAWLLFMGNRRVRVHSARIQRTLAQVSEMAEETLAGVRTVKAFANERHEVTRFDRTSRSVLRSVMANVRVRAGMNALIEVTCTVAVVMVLWYGGREIVAGGALSIGGIAAFILVLKEVSDAARKVANVSLNLSAVSAAAERLFVLLDEPPEIRDAPDARPLPGVEGQITFEQVEFAYRPAVPVLRGLTLTIQPGEVVALVGRSGAGKTTVASLIPRFYEVAAGAVRIDGIDVREVTVESLRAQIGIVPQDPHLFAGTVRDNIAYGRLGAADPEIEAAARAANAHEFILALPEGYATRVGERGVRLSGGQRQRLSIARAVLRNPRILILDEATSSLDNESEALVQEALDRLVRGRTTVVIAHRLTTVRHADRIVVMDRGRIAEQGTHEQLLAANGAYAELYRTQFRHAGPESSFPPGAAGDSAVAGAPALG
jgi:subfamily B ATP-binding cassette protein MsbA